jgi:hypothetical protein
MDLIPLFSDSMRVMVCLEVTVVDASSVHRMLCKTAHLLYVDVATCENASIRTDLQSTSGMDAASHQQVLGDSGLG